MRLYDGRHDCLQVVAFNHRGADVDDETGLRPGVLEYLVADLHYLNNYAY